MAIAVTGLAMTACKRGHPTHRVPPAPSVDIYAPPDCANVRSCVLSELTHEFYPTTRIDWVARVQHCLGPAPMQDSAARLCLPIVFARDTRNDREVGLCNVPAEGAHGPVLAIGYPGVSYAECLCLGRSVEPFHGSPCLPSPVRPRLTEDAVRVDERPAAGHPTYGLAVSNDVPLGGLLALPDTSVLTVRGRALHGASELKRRFLDLIENPPGRLDFVSQATRIKSHEFYLIDRILVDRLVRKMTELGIDALPTLGRCSASDTEVSTGKLYMIDSGCKDDRTRRLLEFLREVELVAADAGHVVKRRVPPATCAELHTLPVYWSVRTPDRIIDLRYVDWATEPSR